MDRVILLCMEFLPVLLLLPLGVLDAQQVQEKLSVGLVNVYLAAIDEDGHFVTDLKPDELTLKEEGKVRTITHFTNFSLEATDKLGESGVPLSVAFVIDTSESMNQKVGTAQKIDIVKNAAFRIMDELREEDQTMLVAFNNAPDEVSALTSDKKHVAQDLLLQNVKGGDTALLDSIYFAMEKLKGHAGRKIVVVCSDGEDTASYLRFEEVLSNLIASDVTLLAFGTMALGSGSLRGRYILEKLAEATGGFAFFPSSLNDLNEVMEKLRVGMRSQYSIGYQPSAEMPNGSWRDIQIECKRPKVKLRYRKGYFGGP